MTFTYKSFFILLALLACSGFCFANPSSDNFSGFYAKASSLEAYMDPSEAKNLSDVKNLENPSETKIPGETKNLEKTQERKTQEHKTKTYKTKTYKTKASLVESYKQQQKQLKQGLNASWKTEFNAKTFTDRSTTDTVLSTEIYGRVDWNFLQSFSFHTLGLIIGRSGFTQSIYDRDDRKNGLYLLEGYFNIQPTPSISLKVGNYNQEFLQAPLLITDRSFPSLLQTFTAKLEDHLKFVFIFQQAIPDNGSESVRRESQIIRGAPLFLTGSAFMEYSKDNFLFKENFTVFSFYNLPPSLAEVGRTRGNSVDFLSSDSVFKYGFFGIHNNISFQFPVTSRSIVEVGGDILYNFLAPDKFNQGERVFGSLYYNYRDFVEFKWNAEYFANQSDTSIAYYNNETYGHNNRTGLLWKMQTYFYQSGITLGITYVYSQPINPERSAIGVSNAVIVSLGTRYISI